MNTFIKSTLITIATSGVLLSGCASQSVKPLSGNSPQAQEARHNTKIAAAKGCALGAGAGILMGLMHHDFSNGMKLAVAGCAVGGVAGGFVQYRNELNKAKNLDAQARSQGLQPVLTTVAVQTNDQKDPTEAFGKFFLPLNPSDVRAHGANTRDLLLKAAAIVNQDTTGRRITITLSGPGQDRDWMRSVVAPQVKDTNRIADKYATNPSIELSPVPQVAGAK